SSVCLSPFWGGIVSSLSFLVFCLFGGFSIGLSSFLAFSSLSEPGTFGVSSSSTCAHLSFLKCNDEYLQRTLSSTIGVPHRTPNFLHCLLFVHDLGPIPITRSGWLFYLLTLSENDV